MTGKDRLKRLRELLAQLERLPATAERDRMVRDVRARIVDVDTGVAPSALSRPSDSPPEIRRAPANGHGGGRRTTPRRRPALPVRMWTGAEVAPDRSPAADDRLALAADELLSLDDRASVSRGDTRTELIPAWRRGLRG